MNTERIFEHVGAIPMYTGRPVRDTAINNDDLLNLKIALNTTDSVDRFLAVIA